MLMNAGDVFNLMRKTYENDKKTSALDVAFKTISKRCFGSIKQISFDAHIAARGVRFTPVINERLEKRQ